MEITETLLKRFLTQVTEKLTGDWVMVGGTVLPALAGSLRSTADIDFFSLQRSDSSLPLMEIAESIGLPVEAVNAAAAYFFFKHYRGTDDLVLLKSSPKCRIFRPSGTFYLILKIQRLTETDLVDSQAWIKWCQKAGEKIDRKAIEGEIKRRLRNNASPELKKRLQLLTAALAKITSAS